MKKMVFSFNFSKLTFFMLAAASISCSRSKMEDTSTLTISLPAGFNRISSLNKTIQKNADIHGMSAADFGLGTPTNISNLNCFMVTVSGPEPGMSANQCKIGTSKIHPVGVFAGFMPSNSIISLDVPSGLNRVISLFGIQTDGTIACPNVSNFDAGKAHMSAPVLIGSVDNIKLLSGSTVSVVVPLATSITSEQVVADCQGPTMGNGGGSGGGGGGGGGVGGGGIPAGYRVITQDDSMSFLNDSCVPMQLKIVDSSNNGAAVTGSYTTALSGTGGVLFSTNPTCGSPTSSISLNFNSFNTMGFFAKMPNTASPIQFVTSGSGGAIALPNGNIGTSYSSIAAVGGPYVLSMVDAMTLKTLGTAASDGSIRNYTCRPYLLQIQDSAHRPYAGAAAGTTVTGALSAAAGFLFYSDNLCATTGVSSTAAIAPSSPIVNNTVYGTFTQQAAAVTFMPPSSISGSGVVPAVITATNFIANTPSGVGIATKFALMRNEMSSVNGAGNYYFQKQGSCQYVGEIAYVDSIGNRTEVTGTGYIAISGFGLNNLFTSSSCTGDLSGATVSSISPSSKAYKIPLYSNSSSTIGTYSMTISSGGLSGTTLTDTTLSFTIGN